MPLLLFPLVLVVVVVVVVVVVSGRRRSLVVGGRRRSLVVAGRGRSSSRGKSSIVGGRCCCDVAVIGRGVGDRPRRCGRLLSCRCCCGVLVDALLMSMPIHVSLSWKPVS